MNTVEILTIIGSAIGILVGTITVLNFSFYSKSQVDKKIDENNKTLKNEIQQKIDNVSSDNKQLNSIVQENNLDAQRVRLKIQEELHQKMDDTKLALEEAMKQFINTLADIKQSDKDMAIQFITLVNGVKDELKNDYIARYNDLLLIINTKANETDFNRLEQKFDKVSETIIELKTIVEHNVDKKETHR